MAMTSFLEAVKRIENIETEIESAVKGGNSKLIITVARYKTFSDYWSDDGLLEDKLTANYLAEKLKKKNKNKKNKKFKTRIVVKRHIIKNDYINVSTCNVSTGKGDVKEYVTEVFLNIRW